MAYTILTNCTACGLCLPECPIDAISAGDPIYVIDQEQCCDFEDCLAVCPVDAIVPSDSVRALPVPLLGAEHSGALSRPSLP